MTVGAHNHWDNVTFQEKRISLRIPSRTIEDLRLQVCGGDRGGSGTSCDVPRSGLERMEASVRTRQFCSVPGLQPDQEGPRA